MPLRETHPFQLWKTWDKVYLVPSNVVKAIFGWARHVTSETLQLFINSPGLYSYIGKACGFKGYGEWMQKESGCNSGI